MTTNTPTNARIIANALHRAASASTEPIKAEELLHPRAAVTRKFLGARLCGLTLHWLNKEQKFSMAYLAKACGMSKSTAVSRIATGQQLKNREGWDRIYRAISQQL